jgi:hypothetical protein
MLKGTYDQAFYVGNQIQLATDAPQLQENNDKLTELILKVDTNLDVAVSTRLADADYVEPATAENVWSYTTRTLTSAGAAGATLEEIEGSLILAMKADVTAVETKVDALGDPMQADDYVAPDNTAIGQIKSKVDTLENYDDSALASAVGSPLQADDYIVPDNAGIESANAKLDAIPTNPLLATAYVAPDNDGIADIQTKVDALQTDLDSLGDVNADLQIINKGVQDASLFIPHTTNLT